MDTLDFLQRVLPTEGVYCRFTLPGKSNRFFGSITELVDAVHSADQRGQDAYFAVSTFVDDSSRKNTNVAATKVVVVDVDCGDGKPFPSWKEGLKALLKFIVDTKLPRPMIVRSGNGLHVYWVLDRSLPLDDWMPLARAMKAAASAQRFPIDMGKTADASVVLRPVGTHNHKDPENPKPVVLLFDAADTTAEALREALSYYYSDTPLKPKNNGLRDSLAVRNEFPPAVGSIIADKCQQIGWAVANQALVTEPLWYALLGVAAFCEDPEETAKLWSQDHPGYSEAETLKKLDQWRAQASGPSTCSKFEGERPAGCKGCPLAGKIGSPALLGVRYKEVDTSAEAPDQDIGTIPIPRPFIRTEIGIVAEIDDTQIPITNFDLYPLGYGYDEHLGYEIAQFSWKRPHVGWSVLTLRRAHLAEGTYREFVVSIADQGIVLESKKQTEWFQLMLRSYIAELQKVRTVTNHYATMGWKEDNRVFILGDDLIRRDDNGSVVVDTIRLASHISRASSNMFVTKGSYAKWRAGTSILRKAHMYPHQYSIGVGLGSVLMQFTGLKGVTISLYGPSGSGKSQAQYIQQSVWGDPEKLHFQSKFTQNSLFSRFGLYGNLPMTIDEATQMTDKDVGDYLYWVSQGRDKARLSRAAEEKSAKEWALFSTLSTNRPIASKLLAEGDENDAQLARMIELRVDPMPIYAKGSEAGRMLHQLFTENCGHAGRDFVMRLMRHDEQEIRAMVTAAYTSFAQDYRIHFSGVERFWQAGCVVPELALRLASEWDIIDFGPTDCMNWVTDQLVENRTTITENHRDLFDLLTEYMNAHLADTIRLTHNSGPYPLVAMGSPSMRSIKIRIDTYRLAPGKPIQRAVMLLDRGPFRKWLAAKGANPREFTQQLKQLGADATPQSGKSSLGKQTVIALPQSYVIGIDLTHPRMVGVLDDLERRDEGDELGNVVSLKPKG
jgi:hypothetical protein